MDPSKLSVLIAGAGIAGPVAAYFLTEAGCNVTLVERAPTLRHNGQGVDIRGTAREVTRRMGVDQQIREKMTSEAGLAFVDEKNNYQAIFPVEDTSTGQGVALTAEIEILRGDLTRILWDAVKDKVQCLLGTTVTKVIEDEAGIDVYLNNEPTAHRYDLVIAADGLFSPTRTLLLSDRLGTHDPIAPLNAFIGYFTLPRTPEDGAYWRWFNAPGSLSMSTRPVNSELTSAYLTTMPPPDGLAALRELRNQGSAAQKKQLHRMFDGIGWESPRILDALDGAEDFYLQEIAQAKMPYWSTEFGHGVCIGDAAHCPSPISGMGTSVAILGPYTLAGEIAKQIKAAKGRDGGDATVDLRKAFQEWEKLFRPFVDRAQKLPPGTPKIANPETWWGIWILRKLAGFVAWSGLANRFGSLVGPPAAWKEMPNYVF